MYQLTIVVCLVCFGGIWAQECGNLQRMKVITQWGEFKANGRARIQKNINVWKSFFRDAPEAKSLFVRVKGDRDLYSPEFKAHMNRVLDGLDMAISLLEDKPTFEAVLTHLNKQHVPLNVPAEHYTTMKNAVIDQVSNAIGPCFDFAAWDACLSAMMTGITA